MVLPVVFHRPLGLPFHPALEVFYTAHGSQIASVGQRCMNRCLSMEPLPIGMFSAKRI